MHPPFSGSKSSASYSELWPIRWLLRKGISARTSRFSGRILDYGCGSRPYEDLFSVDEYVGADVHVSGHDQDDKNADIYFDGLSVPLPSETFDGVIALEVLEHVPDLDATVREMVRLAKRGSPLMITTPFVWPEHEAPYDFARWTRYSLIRAFEDAGCEIEEVVKLGNSVTVILQMFLLFAASTLVIRRVGFLTKLSKCFWCVLINPLVALTAGFRPNSDTLYLTTLVLARKK